MECNSDMIQFSTVKEAMLDAGITLTTKDVTSLLLWRDLLSPIIKYNKIRPWQIINRIPYSNILCLKTPLSIILKESQSLFPSFYDFIPETFILPDEFELFEKELIRIKREAEKKALSKSTSQPEETEKSDESSEIESTHSLDNIRPNNNSKNYPLNGRSNSWSAKDDSKSKCDIETEVEFFVKPSNGSLGNGIKIIQTGELFDLNSFHNSFCGKSRSTDNQPQFTAVAQKYIRSHLIENTKFDLRIYVLVSSVEPFEIFVYRDGLARFCSMKSNCNSIFARITNVTMNKRSFFYKEPDQISRLISDVFDENFTEEQQLKIWSEIDNLIVLTLFSSHRYLLKGVDQFLPNYYRFESDDVKYRKSKYFYSKCFQIFGFDILLRENDLKPFLIEVNYRPSLDFLRNCERRMKVEMIRDSIRIAAPYRSFQDLVKARKWSWSLTLWEEELNSHQELFEKAYQLKKSAICESKYVRIWPFKSREIKENPEKYQSYVKILEKLDQLPIDQQIVRI